MINNVCNPIRLIGTLKKCSLINLLSQAEALTLFNYGLCSLDRVIMLMSGKQHKTLLAFHDKITQVIFSSK